METTTTKPTNGKAPSAPSSSPTAASQLAPVVKTYALLQVNDINEADENERKTYDEAELLELAESVRADGVRVPVLVHPSPATSAVQRRPYEIVYGSRRRRAAKIAKRETIPAIVCDRRLTPKEVRKEQFLENRGHADLHPLEDAEAMRAMIDEDGETALSIAKLRGKSESWVYGRLKLTELAEPVKVLCREGKLPASHALLVARIPDAKLQAEAAAAIVEGTNWQEDEGPMSFKDAQAYIETELMLRLDAAPFDLTDAKLVEKAGPCTTCPKRTGNQPELFADVKNKDLCTDAICFGSKRKADWDLKAADAMRSGLKVLTDKESAAIFGASSTHVLHNSPYVDPHSTDAVPWDVAEGKKTIAQLLGKNTPPKVVARDGQGNARQLVDKATAMERLKKAGLLKKPKASEPKAKTGASSASPKEQRAKEAEKIAIKEAARRIALGKIATAAGSASVNAAKAWRYIAAQVLRHFETTAAATGMVERRGLKPGKKGEDAKLIGTWIAEGKRTGEELRALVVEVLASAHDYRAEDAPLKSAAEAFGVDLKACEAAAKKEQAEKSAKPGAAKKQPPNLAKKARKS